MNRTSPMLRVLIVLAGSLFVVTSSEFQVAAMLTDMATDLGVAPADLALLVTAYALGMGFGGPVVAWALRRISPRRALVLVLAGYAVAEAMAGAMSHPGVLALLRLTTGALSGATFGLALSIGMRMSTERDRARMSSGVLTGLMAGTLVGLPLSHLLATLVGWRASFGVLAAAAAAMAVAVRLVLPATATDPSTSSNALQALRNAQLWVRYLASFLVIGGAFAAFTFIDPLLRRTGLSSAGVTLTLVGFGVAAFGVNHVAGRVPKATARRWLLVGVATQATALAVLLLVPTAPIPVVLATVFIGGTGIALNPLLVSRVVAVAEPNLVVNTVHTSAITLGIAVATTVGGHLISATGDLDGTLLIGLGLTAAAGLAVTLTRDRRLSAE